MFPFRRRFFPSRNFWDFDIDFDIENDFRMIEEEMNRFFEEAEKIASKEPGKYGPFVYGFSMKIGPEGKPIIREFGNVPSKMKLPNGEREPLIDVIESENNIKVIAEIPGVEKNEIKLKTTEEELKITVDNPERKYRKEVKLPCKVNPETAEATYKNGILEVKVEKAEKKSKNGVDVRVQ